ncbi:MAG: putative Zn-dependent protease with MMP-like domain [Hyphomicrobiaceae bacterium]|jgi:predicted Zn-dependent protease with MMP-like domain
MDLEPEGVVPPDTDVAVGNDPAVRDIERLLESGKIEAGLRAIDDAMAAGRGNAADLTFLRGDACLGLGRAREAEREFRTVLQGDPDCPSSRCWLAMCLYLQWRFEEAEEAVAAARALPDALVDADVVAGCLFERRGSYRQADGLFERAATASPDKYSVPVRLTRDEFDHEVQEAVRMLPDQFQQYLESVRVVAQEVPDEAFGRAEAPVDGEPLGPDMLGLFEGVPLADEQQALAGPQGVAPVKPATIYLFQRNLERMATGREDLVEQIRVTMWHELGHYLGFDEDDMERLGLE